jgi:LCP family protein required for cell wall assembly
LPGAQGRRRISRYVPAFLSSIIPGLGQLITGRRTLAALFLFPVVLLIVGVLIALAVMGPARLAASLIEPEVIWGIIGLQVLFVVWRLLAMTASVLDPAYPRPRARDIVPVGLLILFIVVPQGFVLAVTDQARRTADTVFVGDQASDGAWTPETLAPTYGTPGFDDDPDVLPPGASPSPTEGPQRINVLLSASTPPNRSTYLTDTMIVASLDPVGGTVSMVSIPRDMVDVPLPNGRTFAGKINSLVAYARRNPRQFKGANGKGFDVLQGALGTLLGLKIDYYAVVNLNGFASIIDQLGGISVNVERASVIRLHPRLRPGSPSCGRHHLDGWRRSPTPESARLGSRTSRAGRQQEVSRHPGQDRRRGSSTTDRIVRQPSHGQTNVPASWCGPRRVGRASAAPTPTATHRPSAGARRLDRRGSVRSGHQGHPRPGRAALQPGTLPAAAQGAGRKASRRPAAASATAPRRGPRSRRRSRPRSRRQNRRPARRRRRRKLRPLNRRPSRHRPTRPRHRPTLQVSRRGGRR